MIHGIFKDSLAFLFLSIVRVLSTRTMQWGEHTHAVT
jgi:hypothetical protein